MPEEKYVGLIQDPDDWWLATSKRVYDAWDLPEGPFRSSILATAQVAGLLHCLGPSTMTSEQVYEKALAIIGVPEGTESTNRSEVIDFISERSADPKEEQ